MYYKNENINVHKIDTLCLSTDEFRNYLLDRNYNDNMFKPNGEINPKYNSSKKATVIAQIFEDHWDSYYLENKSLIDKYRPNANDEVKKKRSNYLHVRP